MIRRARVASVPIHDGVEFPFDFDKTKEALVFLAHRRQGGADKFTLCKLLFLADRYHLVRFGRTITGDRYAALDHGPVPSHVLNLLNEVVEGPADRQSAEAQELSAAVEIDRRFRYPRLRAPRLLEAGNLSESDVDALDHVIRRFGGMNFDQLKALTHGLVEYKNAWRGRGSRRSMPMAFEDFFEENPDAMRGVFEEMLENAELRRSFSAD